MCRNRHQSCVQRSLSAACTIILTHRLQPLILAALAVMLVLPSLTVGWVIDDHFHRITLLGSDAFEDILPPPLDLFRFLDNPQRTMRAVDIGFLPWWTYPDIKAAFWRPLTSLTHWLDYHLWPDMPVLMHVHSLLWFGLLIIVVAKLYRRFMPIAWMAGLAALLYAIDDAHGMPVGFLANRNALPCTLCGVLAILAHDRWRRSGWMAGSVLGPILLILSLLFKEAGIATCAYLFAHAVFLDSGSWRRRAMALLPYAGVVLVWRIVWSSLDYGVANAGLYIDPMTNPLDYALALVKHVPLLILGQWAGPPSEIALMLSSSHVWLLWGVGVLFTTLLMWLLLPLLRHERTARFWLVGMLLALLPACATFPADRLLFFVGIGAMGLLAQFLNGAFGQPNWRPTGRGWRVTALISGSVFLIIHLVIAPLLLPLRAAYPSGGRLAENFKVRAQFDESIEQQDLILVNPPSVLHVAYCMIEREVEDLPTPRRMRSLATMIQDMVVHRPDAYTLVIRPKNGYLSWRFEQLFRSDKHPFQVGERLDLTGLSITITELNAANRPAVVTFRFAQELESPAYRWLQWQDVDFIPFTPPAVGQRLELRPGKPVLW
ncbi:MAG: hypothetical protein ABIG44_08220 [Planctomycetota bacterium]